MKFRPLHDRVVVRRAEGDLQSKGGITIPETAKEKPQEGEVIAIGAGLREESGKLVPLDVFEDLGIKLENVTLDMLGRAKHVLIEMDTTRVINDSGAKVGIAARIKQIKAQIEETTSDYDKEKKDRIDDALNATRAAVEEGIVPGGGALLRARTVLTSLTGVNADVTACFTIVLRAHSV
jgi:co-chaperonin GroES (HSP10)